MRIEGISKGFRAALIPAFLIASASFVLPGCGDSSGPGGTGGLAPVSPLALDKKAMEESKAAMLKDRAPRKK